MILSRPTHVFPLFIEGVGGKLDRYDGPHVNLISDFICVGYVFAYGVK